MAQDLVGLFLDLNQPDISMETAWLVCQRCLHGRKEWHLRCYVSHWNFPDDDLAARELSHKVKNYWPVPGPIVGQERIVKRAPALTHLGHTTRAQVQKQLPRLHYFLTQEISDDEAAEYVWDHTLPPGFECLQEVYWGVVNHD